MMVIEHLFDPFHAFKEIKRVLSSDGLAVVNLPLVANVKNRIRPLFGYVPTPSISYERWFTDKEWDGNHLHYFSLPAIQKLARLSGLIITAVSGVGNYSKLKSVYPAMLAGEINFLLEHSIK